MKKALLMTLAAAAALPVPVAAQAATNGKAIYDMGRCIARTDRAAAVRLLGTLPLTGEADVRGSISGEAASCLSAAPASVSAIDMRGALAQDLFIKDFKEFGVQPKRAPYDMAKVDLPVGDEDVNFPLETRAMYRLADCAVRNDTARIEQLVMSPVGSTREQNVLDSMAPTLAACMPKGVPVKVNSLTLRGLLTQSAYNVATRFANGGLSGYDKYKNQ